MADDRLAALVKEWREHAARLERNGSDRFTAYEFCANALELALSSPAPAPSDVVIPGWVALALEHEIGNIAADEARHQAYRVAEKVTNPGTDAVAEAWQVLAAALRQGGGG